MPKYQIGTMKFARLDWTYFDGSQNYRVDVSIRRQFWNLLFFEKFLTPIFEIKIENKGENIEKGTIQCDIAECDNPNICFIIEEKYFMNFQNFRFMNFEKGNTLKFKPKVNSDFIKQNGRYVVRFIVKIEVPYEKSNYEELKEKYGETIKIRITEYDPPVLAFSGSAKTWTTVKLPTPALSGNATSGETSKIKTTYETLEELIKKHPDWKKPKVGSKKEIPIGDYRWNRIVAVYPLSTLVALIPIFIIIFNIIIELKVNLIIQKINEIIHSFSYFLSGLN